MIGVESRLQQQLSRENELLRSLQRLIGKMIRKTDKDELLEEILHQATQFTEAPNGAISLIEPDGETLRLCFGLGSQASRAGYLCKVTDGVAGEVWRSGKVQIIEDYRTWQNRMDIMELGRMSTIVMAPLKASGEIIGMIQVSWNDEVYPLRAEELNIIDQFTVLASVALENALLFQKARDEIRERRLAEAELQRERSFSRAVIDSIPGMFYVYDEQGRLIRWNKQQETLTGYSPEQIKEMTLLDWYSDHPEAQRIVAAATEKALQSGYADARVDLIRKNGLPLSLYLTAIGLTVDDKQYLVGIGTDITKIREAEDTLRTVNEELETKVAKRTQELNGLNQELTAMYEEMTAMNQELTAMNESLSHTNDLLHKEVEERQKAEQNLRDSMLRQQDMQEYLIQSEKMAALGNLVAGVAHEVNTPVGVGVTAASHLKQITQEFTELCTTGAPRRTELNGYLEDIVEAADILLKNLERASTLIKGFKQISADQSSEERRVFKAREYLGEIILSMNPRLKKTRQAIVVECDENLEIDGFPGAFAQVVTNLVMNSLRHAYGPNDSGTLRITLSAENGAACLVFSDDGSGIEPDVLPRIFDPFFTTKRGAGGTGLGLFLVYNIIVQQFGGTITCDSQLGQGTVFTIHFPLHGSR